MKGLFIPEITAEMFRNGCLESIEQLMAEGEIYDIEYARIEQNKKTDTWSIKEVADALERHGLLEQEQKQGQWETEKKGTFGAFYVYRCSECHELYHTKTNYCPNCGAKLVKDSQG